MNSEKILLVWSAAYGLLVLSGSALLGFVIAPAFGIASGLFPIDTEARAFFSLLTLKGAPYLVGLAVLSALVYPHLASRRRAVGAGLFLLNVLAAWFFAAGLALASLG